MVHNHDHAGIKWGGGICWVLHPPSCATEARTNIKLQVQQESSWSILFKEINQKYEHMEKTTSPSH